MASQTAKFNRPSALAAQFLPPLIGLWPVLARSDSVLYLGVAFALLVAVVSTISLLKRLFGSQKNRGRMLRPTLALMMSALVLMYAAGQRKLVTLRVNGLAQSMQHQCQHFNRCPKTILGWDKGQGRFAASMTEGDWLQHRYLYVGNGNHFELHLDLWGGFDDIARGGADQKLKPLGNLPWR